MDDENITQWVLPNDKPYVSELDENGEWPRDVWISHIPMVLELHVAGAFDTENTIRRTLSKPRTNPLDGSIVTKIHQQLIRRYHIEPGVPVEIPRTLRRGVREETCSHTACLQRPFTCRNPGHPHTVVGGLGPHMQLVGEVLPPRVHPSIEDRPAAPQPPILEAIDPKPVKSPEALAIERARARRAGGER